MIVTHYFTITSEMITVQLLAPIHISLCCHRPTAIRYLIFLIHAPQKPKSSPGDLRKSVWGKKVREMIMLQSGVVQKCLIKKKIRRRVPLTTIGMNKTHREIEKNSVGSGEQSFFMESIHFKSVQSFQWIAPFFRSFHLRRSISSPTSIQRLSIGLIIFELNNTCKKGGGIQQIKIGIEIISISKFGKTVCVEVSLHRVQYIEIIHTWMLQCMFHFVYLSSNDRIMQQSQGMKREFHTEHYHYHYILILLG
ncbi:Palmitoyltransferase ZDHHC17 [Dirofilaria immitis]